MLQTAAGSGQPNESREIHLRSMRSNRILPLAGMVIAFLFLLIFTLGAKEAAAAESPFKIEFDASDIQVNAIKDLPLDALSTKASLEGTIDENGNVTIPKGGFVMPELGITDPVSVKGFMGIEGPATGTYNAATGQLDLDTTAGLWVSVNVKQLLDAASGLGIDLSGSLGGIGQYVGLIGNLTCGFSPMNLHFSTEPNSLTSGQRFATGPGGPGAISAEWSKLGPFAGRTKVLGIIDACQLLKDQLPTLLAGLGGTELGGFDIGSLLGDIDLSNLNDVDLGPSAITLTRTSIDPPDPDDPGEPVGPTAAKLKLSVTPKTRRAKAGAKIRYRATVKNVGGTKADAVKVCVKAPKKAVSVKRCQNLGSVSPGASKVRQFNLKLKKGTADHSYRIGFETRSGSGARLGTKSLLRVR